MNRRRLFKVLALAPFALPAIAKAIERRDKQVRLYDEQAEVYRRLRQAATQAQDAIWYAPQGLNRGSYKVVYDLSH
jgi:hypothetical protein